MSSYTSEPRKVARFCSYCGTKLDEGARFCKGCGEPVGAGAATDAQPRNATRASHSAPLSGNPTERKTVYEGTLHKCPNCGEILASFVSVCPTCAHEIRDTKSSTAVRELALKLERIEAQKMPAFEEKKSVMKMVFGKDFNEEDEAEEAQERFDEQKAQEKATLIINFSVPNTKEDILEFMILASSNINIKNGVDDVVTQAWISKLEQVYQRARLIMGNSQDFAIIQNIYEQKRSELKSRKFKGLAIAAFIVGGYMLLMSFIVFMAETPAAAVILLLVGIALLVGGIKSISIYTKKNKHNL